MWARSGGTPRLIDKAASEGNERRSAWTVNGPMTSTRLATVPAKAAER
jgi:hypothetical protein